MVVLARTDISYADDNIYNSHKDWFCIDKDAKPVMAEGKHAPCINGAYYHEYVPAILREIIENYRVDGIMDNNWSGRNKDTICYCENCRKKFHEETRLDLPESVNWNNSVYRAWIRWNYTIRAALSKEYNAITKSSGGEDCLWIGLLGPGLLELPYRFYDLRQLSKDADIVILDQQGRLTYTGFEQNTSLGYLFHSMMKDTATVMGLTGVNLRGTRNLRLSAPPRQEVRTWMEAGISSGMVPCTHYLSGDTQDKRKFEMVNDITQWYKKNRKYLTCRKNMAKIALLWNQETMLYFGRDDNTHRFVFPISGFERALSHAGIPYRMIHSDDFCKYVDLVDLVILPELAIITKEVEQEIVRFIRRGGSVIMSGMTALCDYDGEPRQDENILWHEFGLKHIGSVGKYSNSLNPYMNWLDSNYHTYLVLADREHEALKCFEDTEILPFGGKAQVVESDGTLQALAGLTSPIPIFPPEKAYINESDECNYVIYTGETRDGGKLVYLGADIAGVYCEFAFPDLKDLIGSLTKWASKEMPAIVESEHHINCDVYHKDNKIIIHLVNLDGDESQIGTLTSNSGIFDAKVIIGMSIRVKSVKSLVTGYTYSVKNQTIKIQPFQEHEVLVIEKEN
jgi:hypothetical protein